MKTLTRRSARLIAVALAAVFAIGVSRSAIAQDTLAETFNFTTANGTVQANGHVAGLPTAATSFFNRQFIDLPISDPEDPLGTARHELFHGIGFARAYDSFSAHLFSVTGGPLDGKILFNTSVASLGNDLAVITAGGTHDVAADFTGMGLGGTLIDQRPLLMTPAPMAGQPIPYPVDFRDRDILDSAFNWSNIGGIQINVIFDNSKGIWTPAEENLVNIAAANVQGVFGPANGANVFTWTVEVPEPSSVTLLVLGGLGLFLCYRRRK